ncbi:HEAT repeat domain-containing protein [Thermodesulfobacteriota bacterium]
MSAKMKSLLRIVVVMFVMSIFVVPTLSHAKSVDELLTDLKSDKDTTRGAAAKALGKSGDVKAVEPLLEALKAENEREEEGENDKVEQYIIEALGQLKDRRAVKTLIDVVKGEGEVEDEDEKSYVQEAAIKALGDIGDPSAKEALEDAAEEKDPRLKRAAQKALEKLK